MPEERILSEATRELLEIVVRQGSREQIARLRRFDAYTYSLDIDKMISEEEEYEQALDELRELVLEVRTR